MVIAGTDRPDGYESIPTAAFMVARTTGVVPVADITPETFMAIFTAHIEVGVGVVIYAIGLAVAGSGNNKQCQNKRQTDGPS